MQETRWAIIGPGRIAQQFSQALQGTAGARLYAVASRDKQRAQEFADKYAADMAYDDYHQLLADPSVDAVYIATPHSHHFAIARDCLLAKKPLLMEKPLTVNANQTAHLVELSRQHNVVFQEALWSRYMPCFQQVKKWIADGEIGELQYITSQIGFAFSHLKNHRLTLPELAGGATLDLGVYSVSISQFILQQQPLLIQAVGQINQDGVDQNTSVNLVYPCGVFSQFTCTIGAQCTNSMTIHGKQGYISLTPPFWTGVGAQLVKDNEVVEQQDFPHPVNGFEYQILSTMESIATNRLCDPSMDHIDSINVMHTLDEIRGQIGLTYPAGIESCDQN